MRSELRLVQTFIGSFVFFDKGQVVVLVNAFQKKSQKTPKNQLDLAEKLKNEYFDEKDK